MMRYRKVSDYFKEIFSCKVQKIAVNAGLGCPNRDGTVGTGGCIYCNNAAFNPAYAHRSCGSITDQLAAGVKFCSGKGDPGVYLAYFQSYSNTYGPLERLVPLYEEALAFPGVAGLVIATRPDCLSSELLDWLEQRFGSKAPQGHPYLLVELGVESTSDKTLELINRGHDFRTAAEAIRELDRRGIDVGAHLILGLPGETEEDFMQHATRISQLPIRTLKLHQLQVIKGTPLARQYEQDPEALKLFSADEYAQLLSRFIAELREDIALDRLVSESPKDLLMAPCWGLKPSEFSTLLDTYL